MKKILFISLLAFWSFLASWGQVSVKMGAGSSVGKSAIVEAGVGYNWQLINVSGLVTAHTSASIKTGVLFQVKVGHDINFAESWGVIPQVGYSYHYASSDFKNMNTGHTLWGGEVYKMFREDIGVYGSFTRIGGFSLVSFGIRGYLGN